LRRCEIDNVESWRKKADDSSLWAIILKEAVAILYGPYGNDEEDEE